MWHKNQKALASCLLYLLSETVHFLFEDHMQPIDRAGFAWTKLTLLTFKLKVAEEARQTGSVKHLKLLRFVCTPTSAGGLTSPHSHVQRCLPFVADLCSKSAVG